MTITRQPHALRRLQATTAHLPLRAGRQIAAARALAGLSQMDLAALGGWHPRTVRLWEATPCLPTSHRPHLDRLMTIFAGRSVTFKASPLGVHVTGGSGDVREPHEGAPASSLIEKNRGTFAAFG
jgi:DNA-binding transcriptional regulator YiaG